MRSLGSAESETAYIAALKTLESVRAQAEAAGFRDERGAQDGALDLDAEADALRFLTAPVLTLPARASAGKGAAGRNQARSGDEAKAGPGDDEAARSEINDDAKTAARGGSNGQKKGAAKDGENQISSNEDAKAKAKGPKAAGAETPKSKATGSKDSAGTNEKGKRGGGPAPAAGVDKDKVKENRTGFAWTTWLAILALVIALLVFHLKK